uniref:Serine/threonine-protein phosphatase 7 long form n=1 Tax=Anthurium amnicola TaxID=1678845 RepID=A0A1D1ZD79_9ARAE
MNPNEAWWQSTTISNKPSFSIRYKNLFFFLSTHSKSCPIFLFKIPLFFQQQLPSLPGSHRFGKPAWLTPLLSTVEFTIKKYFHQWGLLQLLDFAKHFNNMFIHWEAIGALIEIWHPQTHTFIFSSFEATILIEETELLLGLKDNRAKNKPVAHSMVKSSGQELMFKLTENHAQARNIASQRGIRLSILAKWIMKAKGQGIDHEGIAQALSLCLAGLFYFPKHDDFLDEEFLGPIQGAWHGRSLAQPILAHLYSGLSSACLGKPFHGSVILLDNWLSFHMKIGFSADTKTKSCNRSPIFRLEYALHCSDQMIIKTPNIRTRDQWRSFINKLLPRDFFLSSKALPKLKTRPYAGIDLRLVGSKELVLYNAHRCHLQLQQPRHMVPPLSHYQPIELRIFESYHDQVDVRTCLELWKINDAQATDAEMEEDKELVKAYTARVQQLKSLQ